MTALEQLILYFMIVFGGGYYLGSNNDLMVPHRSFRNSYLKIVIKRDLNNEDLESRFHKGKFSLRARPVTGNHFFFINLVQYPIIFLKNKRLEEYSNKFPKKVKLSPTEYFLEDCEYIAELPTNVWFEVGLGIYSLTSSINLMPDQTLQISLESINGELRSETNNLKSYEIIPTPIDLKESQKCNFEIEARDKHNE